jgi:hypothetical protein
VEAVASQSPKELTRLIEQISGSLELSAEYKKAKEAQSRSSNRERHFQLYEAQRYHWQNQPMVDRLGHEPVVTREAKEKA